MTNHDLKHDLVRQDAGWICRACCTDFEDGDLDGMTSECMGAPIGEPGTLDSDTCDCGRPKRQGHPLCWEDAVAEEISRANPGPPSITKLAKQLEASDDFEQLIETMLARFAKPGEIGNLVEGSWIPDDLPERVIDLEAQVQGILPALTMQADRMASILAENTDLQERVQAMEDARRTKMEAIRDEVAAAVDAQVAQWNSDVMGGRLQGKASKAGAAGPGKPNDGWISVEDRLPPDGPDVEVLVTDGEYQWVASLTMTAKGWCVISPYGAVDGLDGITHWRPLPAPPKA